MPNATCIRSLFFDLQSLFLEEAKCRSGFRYASNYIVNDKKDPIEFILWISLKDRSDVFDNAKKALDNFETLLKGIGFTDVSLKTAENKNVLCLNIPDNPDSVARLQAAVQKAGDDLGKTMGARAAKQFCELFEETGKELVEVFGKEKGTAYLSDAIECARVKAGLPAGTKPTVTLYLDT